MKKKKKNRKKKNNNKKKRKKKKRHVRLLIFIINYQKYEEELRHLLQQNLSLSLRSSSALISEIEDQLTKCIYIYIYMKIPIIDY